MEHIKYNNSLKINMSYTVHLLYPIEIYREICSIKNDSSVQVLLQSRIEHKSRIK